MNYLCSASWSRLADSKLFRSPSDITRETASEVLVGLSLIAIVLSTAALYALMSFTVARRTREIGVRIALGGRSSRIVFPQ